MVKELIYFGNDVAWSYVSDVSYVFGAIEYSKGGMCYNVDLTFELSESLQMLLLNTYDNDGLNSWFENRRPGFDYSGIYNKVKKDRVSRKIVIDAWNKYSPCMKSKLLNIISLFSY